MQDVRLRHRQRFFFEPIRGPRFRRPTRHHHCRLPLKGLRRIKSSNGHIETRAVVETDVKIGATTLRMEITLTDRTDMGVAMLLGRSSIGHDFLVHPTKTNILSARKRKAP